MEDQGYYKVHKSLLRKDLVFGVPRLVLFFTLIVSMFFIVNMQLYWFVLVTVAVILLMRWLTKQDEHLLDFVFNSLLQPDDFYP